MKLNFKNWKEFKIKEIFIKNKVKKIKAIPNNTKGNIPLISSKSTNNGIACYVERKYYIEHVINEKCITVSTNGSCFECFYQDNPFVVNSDVEVLFHEKLNNKYIALFLTTILSFQKGKYSYGMKNKGEKTWNTIISLPVDDNGQIDWEYMEQYIKSLEKKEISLNELQKPFLNEFIQLETQNWKTFKLSNFNLYASKNNLDKSKIIRNETKARFNYITRTNLNNGVTEKICEQEVKINKGNCLIIGLDTSTCFYQEEDFYSGQNIQILRIENANKYIYLFFATLISKLLVNFSWGSNGATLGRLMESEIKLPIDNNGEPDWEYMEKYIKSLLYSKYL